MHINWGFWGAMLGVSTIGQMWSQRQENGDELAKELIMLAGNGADDEFFRALGRHNFRGSYNQAWVSAFDASTQMQQLHDGVISSAPHVLRFRDWCRSIV
jgi:glycogen debranching enzyme